MTVTKTIGLYILFFSLPLIAILKGKGIVLSLVLAFFLFNGPRALKSSIQIWIDTCTEKNSKALLWVIGGGMFFWEALVRSHNLMRPWQLMILFITLFFTAKGCLTLPPKDQKKATDLFFVGYIAYLLFFLVEIYGGSWASKFCTGFTAYNHTLFIRGIVILTFLFPPFSWYLLKLCPPSKRKISLGLFLLALISILIKAQPSAARLAVALSIVFFIFGYFYKKSGFILMSIVGLYMLAAPFLFLHIINRHTLFNVMHHLPSSYQHRIEIWHETAKYIVHHPLYYIAGHGFDASYTLEKASPRCAHHPSTDFQAVPPSEVLSKTSYPWGGVVCYKETILSTHPHNSALQIWLEFGLMGIGVFCFFLYRFTLYCSFLPSLYRGYLYSLMALCLVYWNVSFGFWQNWMIALVGLTFMLFQLIKGLPSKEKEAINV